MADSMKSTVLIASVLKPVDDSRMYEKIGLTLAESGVFDVHVVGTPSARTGRAGITQHSLKPFTRISLGRLLAPWRILSLALRLRPDIVIITTHELLYLAMFMKIRRKCNFFSVSSTRTLFSITV